MSRLDRSKILARRRSAPVFDSLEGRQLLSTASVSDHATSAVHAQVVKVSASHAIEHAATSKSTVHAAIKATTHSTSKATTHAAKVTTSKATTHTVKVSTSKVTHASKAANSTAAVPLVSHKIGNRFLDATVTQVGTVDGSDGTVQASSTPIPGAYTPSQVQTAYGVNLLGLANQGQGVTIGIVDEFNDPNILNDANVFSTQYKLPVFDGLNGDPTLTVIKDTAFAAVPNSSHNPNSSTAGETALDVEWAHAMAPKANIVLVFVPSTVSINNVFAELLHGVQVAASQPGVVAVSLSYGYPEANLNGTPSLTSLDSTYLAPGTAASNVAVTVSSGDYALPLFPATSPNVIAVGGTSLYLASAKGRYSFETAWGGLSGAGSGGGGLSSTFGAPTYQTNNSVSFGSRAIPDLSLIADPVTGVSVYDSWTNNTGWTVIGGTSLASPVFAGIVALGQQDRLAAGSPILNSFQINTALYAAYNSPSYSTYFHDITLGNNNDAGSGYTYYNATSNYDLATGIGSPMANTIVPYLTSL